MRLKRLGLLLMACVAFVACLMVVGCGSSASDDSDVVADCPLEDGTYTVEFTTDLMSMFHLNEVCDGRATLTVENGHMTAHLIMPSKNIVNLFVGTAEDAQKSGADLIEPTTEEVTYDDGWTEEVNAFDLPVTVLDEEFDCALVGTKGTWYDHKVMVSDAQSAE